MNRTVFLSQCLETLERDLSSYAEKTQESKSLSDKHVKPTGRLFLVRAKTGPERNERLCPSPAYCLENIPRFFPYIVLLAGKKRSPGVWCLRSWLPISRQCQPLFLIAYASSLHKFETKNDERLGRRGAIQEPRLSLYMALHTVHCASKICLRCTYPIRAISCDDQIASSFNLRELSKYLRIVSSAWRNVPVFMPKIMS